MSENTSICFRGGGEKEKIKEYVSMRETEDKIEIKKIVSYVRGKVFLLFL